MIDPVRDVAIWEWSSKSEVFGNQVPNVDADGHGVGFELALRFPGQQATDASGMFYNYQREYDPVVGRYSQSDPIGLDGGVSTFAYVAGQPLMSSPCGPSRSRDMPRPAGINSTTLTIQIFTPAATADLAFILTDSRASSGRTAVAC